MKGRYLFFIAAVLLAGVAATIWWSFARFSGNADWTHYLGDPSGSQYSALDQINTDNVHLLEVTWEYETGDSAVFESNNLIVEGILYATTPTRKVTGTENYGGPVATADEKFRAFDKETSEVIWEYDLPFGGNATRSTYAVDGVQYVVISAGGWKSNRPAGGTIVAFALP